MAKLVIKGHANCGREVIELLEILGGKNSKYCIGNNPNSFYFIDDDNAIDFYYLKIPANYTIFTLEEFLEKFPYKVGDKVETIYGKIGIVDKLIWCDGDNAVRYLLEYDEDSLYFANELQPYKEENMEEQDNNIYFNKEEDKGNISDGYHTLNELYEYRLLYNASMFNELAKQGLYDVHKSKHHSDGSIPFDDENWFIVQAELPTGQISNHYEMKDWDLFDIPIKDKANPYDGHTPQDVAKRLREFLTPKSKYPTTYKECCDILGICTMDNDMQGYKWEILIQLQEIIIARDAYWKIAGKEMGLGKSWEPDWSSCEDKFCITIFKNKQTFDDSQYISRILVFPTEEIRDTFYENFKDLIKECKELL